MNAMVKDRENWIDSIKIFACMLVVLGHFFQSMIASDILPDSDWYQWFNQTIYYFHVPLFFISSGYLYQRYSRVFSFVEWKKNICKKAIGFGIPYFIFSFITWLLKTIFSGSVNSEAGSLFHVLILEPLSPYWYLYCLFFIFLFTPTLKNRRFACGGLVISLLLKSVNLWGFETGIYAIDIVLSNEVWFFIGMLLALNESVKRAIKDNKCVVGIGLSLLFLVLSIIVYKYDFVMKGGSFVLGLLGCAATILVICHLSENKGVKYITRVFAKYTMPIFLMHTIFAAGFRSILLKIGTDSAAVHVIVGIGISFIGPIIAAIIWSWFTTRLVKRT